jgi:hypothetical protein
MYRFFLKESMTCRDFVRISLLELLRTPPLAVMFHEKALHKPKLFRKFIKKTIRGDITRFQSILRKYDAPPHLTGVLHYQLKITKMI